MRKATLTFHPPSLILVSLLLLLAPVIHMLHIHTTPIKSQTLSPLPRKEVAQISAMEFRPLLSDYYLVLVAQLYGGMKARLGKEEVMWMARALDLAASLDPYYTEPYYFAGNVIPWYGAVDTVIPILKRGIEYKKGDWRIPFYLGFIYFYFKKDPVKGAKYLSMATQNPHAPSYLPLLVARLYSEKGHYSAAIAYLEGLYRSTQDPKLKETIGKRLSALIIMDRLEKLGMEYKKRYGTFPRTPRDLVEAGLLNRVPRDPYGGRFFFKKDGTVWTTSSLRERKRPKAKGKKEKKKERSTGQ